MKLGHLRRKMDADNTCYVHIVHTIYLTYNEKIQRKNRPVSKKKSVISFQSAISYIRGRS